jgi:ABC-type amino acid transport system permease subunit
MNVVLPQALRLTIPPLTNRPSRLPRAPRSAPWWR